MNTLKKITGIFVLLLLAAANAWSQLPQNIDPGQEANPPSLWQNPRYIVPVAVIVVLLVGFYFWRSRKRP